MAEILSKENQARDAIQRVVDLFCLRCATAVEALNSSDWDRFDEFFQLQRMAWVNLNAMVSKFEGEFSPGSSAGDLASTIRAWIGSCQQASLALQQRIAQSLSEIDGQNRTAGRLKMHLGAFDRCLKEANGGEGEDRTPDLWVMNPPL